MKKSKYNIVDVLNFQQDINATINDYIEILQKDDVSNNRNLNSLVTQIITYYNRLVCVYKTQQEDDDEVDVLDDEVDVLDEDEDEVLDDDSEENEDYTKIIDDEHIYRNPDNIYNKDIIDKENELTRKLLGLSHYDNINESNDDSSVDKTFYPSLNNDSYSNNLQDNINDDNINDEDDTKKNDGLDETNIHIDVENGDYILNNDKKIFKISIPNSDIEIINENTADINYDEPSSFI